MEKSAWPQCGGGDGPVGSELLQAKHFLKLFRNSTSDIGKVDLDLGLWQCQDGDRKMPVLYQVDIKRDAGIKTWPVITGRKK